MDTHSVEQISRTFSSCKIETLRPLNLTLSLPLSLSFSLTLPSLPLSFLPFLPFFFMDNVVNQNKRDKTSDQHDVNFSALTYFDTYLNDEFPVRWLIHGSGLCAHGAPRTWPWALPSGFMGVLHCLHFSNLYRREDDRGQDSWNALLTQ